MMTTRERETRSVWRTSRKLSTRTSAVFVSHAHRNAPFFVSYLYLFGDCPTATGIGAWISLTKRAPTWIRA